MKSFSWFKKFGLLLCLLGIMIVGYEVLHCYNRNKTYTRILIAREQAIAQDPSLLLYKSLEQEIKILQLAVHGSMPAWLEGTLVRVGPGKFEAAKQPVNHIFDGFAMLHAFSFKDGQVSYANKFLQTHYYQQALKTGYVAGGGFNSDPCGSLFARVATLFSSHKEEYDNANVNVAKLAHDFIAMTETPLAIQFDPKSLATKGHYTFNDNLRGQVTTAHPHIDGETGDCFNYLVHFGRHSTYNLYRIKPPSTTRMLIASVPVEKPSYMHSFGLTKNYFILTEIPLRVSPLSLLVKTKSFIENYVWEPEVGTRFTVVNRHTGAIVGRYRGDPFFMFHHINAFEDDHKIHVDIVARDRAPRFNQGTLDDLLVHGKATQQVEYRPQRYTINLQDGTVTKCMLASVDMEMPRINYERCNMKPYTYLYGVSGWTFGDFGRSTKLVKVNVHDGSVLSWTELDCYLGEPVFVASPNAHQEDAGVILSVVLDACTSSSFLLVLDAATFTELARAKVPHHIPVGLHGIFFDGVK